MSCRKRLSAVMRCVSPYSITPHSAALMMRGMQVVGKDALGAARVAVDGEGDALVQKGDVGGLLAHGQFRRRQFQQSLIERIILRARASVWLEHLIIGLRRDGRRQRGIGHRKVVAACCS
jgi:hypothetical protein